MLEAFAGKFPQIEDGAFVHERAVLIGDVHVAQGASVWPNTTLRGDDGAIVVGEQSSIQDGTVIHSTTGLSKTTVGRRVTVGHNAILHGCTLEDECLVGMGAIIQDNAVVERGAIVGAGTLISAGKRVRAGTVVVGNPMRVLRECNDRDRGLIEFSWREYIGRTAEYLAERGH